MGFKFKELFMSGKIETNQQKGMNKEWTQNEAAMFHRGNKLSPCTTFAN